MHSCGALSEEHGVLNTTRANPDAFNDRSFLPCGRCCLTQHRHTLFDLNLRCRLDLFIQLPNICHNFHQSHRLRIALRQASHLADEHSPSLTRTSPPDALRRCKIRHQNHLTSNIRASYVCRAINAHRDYADTFKEPDQPKDKMASRGAWGSNFFESDLDCDIVLEMNKAVGIHVLEDKARVRLEKECARYGGPMPDMDDPLSGGKCPFLSIFGGHCADMCLRPMVRKYMEAGPLQKLIDEKKAKMEVALADDEEMTDYTQSMSYAVYELVILGACAMSLGCKLPDDFKELLIKKYRTTELQRDALHVMELALGDGPRRYKTVPYSFGSKNISQMAKSKPKHVSLNVPDIPFGSHRNPPVLHDQVSYIAGAKDIMKMPDSKTEQAALNDLFGIIMSDVFGKFGSPPAQTPKSSKATAASHQEYGYPPAAPVVSSTGEYSADVCGNCGAGKRSDKDRLFCCGKCKAKKYCSKFCQKAHYKQHKLVCKEP
jgi:hypothetical protein